MIARRNHALMRITNSKHVPWFLFTLIATAAATWLYVGNFYPERLSGAWQLPDALRQTPSDHRSIGGTPLGLWFGSIALAIFVFAVLLSARKKVRTWPLGRVQRWMRAHIWLTLLTIPLVLFHSGFRLGGPMTTLIVLLYVIVMVSGVYGLALQHQMPRIMKERLPAETVFEQIPHIREQVVIAAQKMRDSFKPAPPKRTDAGAPAPSPVKTVTSGSTPMASTVGDISTPTARAKTVVGSTIIAAPLNPSPSVAAVGTATKPEAPLPGVASAKPGAAEGDADSEAVLVEFLERQVLPYLKAKRGERFRLGNSRFSDDAFRFVKLRVPEVYRSRVEEIQAWCDERRMLDLQTKLHHWLHAWLFVHVPFSFLLLMLTAWHAFVTLFYY